MSKYNIIKYAKGALTLGAVATMIWGYSNPGTTYSEINNETGEEKGIVEIGGVKIIFAKRENGDPELQIKPIKNSTKSLDKKLN